ncbi:hypothetical protein CLU83_1856 [Flavobacterium sp. 1]|uniref:hypothetical protein n=1 Tax=Flavobacterium sp. 1 TaxID=2035200 RepID=UPI000C231D04|nr:hypothetical protein [Flavobacterium sp. 1]PJJ08572.1 hypothetical protein CLU83_1856 [Flavobacterium sp. 1]
MFESYSSNRSFLYFLWIVLSIGFLQAQEKKNPDIEKTYLHTDRATYFMGEDLWYKAYNVRASNNLLFDNSNILYVELISPDFKIIARNKTNLEIGLGNGDFKLADSLGVKPGHYQIRAYTNWNRNFGEDFVFKKDIEIFDVKASVIQSNAEVIKALATDVENTVKVDFFPEGGSLLENNASVVGFKAVDSNGNPIDIKGEIFDSDNELVTSFASSHDGMGKFQIIPIKGKHYYAKIKTLAGEEIRAELPIASKEGYLLSFRVFRGKNIITITTNPETLSHNPNTALRLVGKAKGITYLETVQTLAETALSFELPKDKTPEGVSQITLYDSNSKPQSERLVYIEKENDLDVQLATDKLSYKPEEKTTINVTSKSKTGVVKSASFSLSVTDMNGALEDKDFGTNISSYFLMESDIRGKVHNPAYYFDPANLKRQEYLDNLLLTQGWRDFLWKTAPMANESISYIAEKGITISGRVKQLLADKPLVNNNMTLALMNKKHFNFFNAATDSNGVYKFENLMFSGKTTMYLNSRNEKGKFRGEIVANPIEQPPIPVSFKSETSSLPETTLGVVENVYRKFIAFGIKPENILKEVSISVQKKSSRPSMLGIPDFSYVADESTAQFTDIYQLIEKTVPGVTVDVDSVRFTRYEGSPLFILDGIEVIDKLQVGFVIPADVIKIETVKGTQATVFYGNAAANGVIAITTKGNTGQQRKKETFHSIKQELEGFYTARVFYVPNPEKPNLELDSKAAVRNTLYWNPYVHPDKTGNVSVNYYNSGVETKVKVVLEGITGSGIPVVKKAYYTINK